MRTNHRPSSINLERPISVFWSFLFLSKVSENTFELGVMTYHDTITCQCKEQYNFSLCQCYKRSILSLHSFKVHAFFEVFSHNVNFRDVDCAYFVHCAFVAEKKSEKVPSRCGKKWTTWRVETCKCETLLKFQFHIKTFKEKLQ